MSLQSPLAKIAAFARENRFPSFNQWLKLPRILSPKEQKTALLLAVLFAASFLFLASQAYVASTRVVPSPGGTLVEGMVGTPRFLNPVYAEVNDTDRALTQLLFSGLLRYDSQGKLVGDLAQEWSILEGGRVFEVTLKDEVRWHDGYALDADDVLFTVQTVQDPRYKSPVRANWVGVTVQKVSPLKVRFILKDPFAAFPERLTSLKILPRHLWQDVSPENFALSFLNLQPVGTGPYRFADLKRDKSGAVREVRLKAHTRYHLQGPYITNLVFRFYDNETALLKDADAGRIQALSLTAPNTQRFRNPALVPYEFSLPRAYALFFNLEADSPVAEYGARKALSLTLDVERLNNELFEGKAIVLSSPLRPDLFDFDSPPVQEKDTEQALALLQEEGYQQAESGNLVEVALASEFASDLRRGNQGPAVSALQECLAQDPEVYPLGTVNGVFGPATQRAVTAFQEKYAEEVLAPSGLSRGTGTVGPATRAKLNELCAAPREDAPLRLTLTTVDQSPLKEVASFVAESWGELGIATDIVLLTPGELERDVLKPRKFEILLFGEVLGKTPDPLPFWHSSQAKDPGLNLTGYSNQTADIVLEQIRRTLNPQERAASLLQMQELLLDDLPAFALYDLPFQYVVSKEIQGIEERLLAEPGERFSAIAEWYIETGRVWDF